jgi:hypothetical protein
MDRSERGHLSDMDIARLLTGSGSRALHQALAEHLDACAVCRDLMAQAAIAQRHDSQGTEARGGPVTVPADGFLVEVLETLEAAFPAIVNAPAARRRIALAPLLVDAPAEPLALAAKPAPAQAHTLPTLTSDDGMILVHFRRPSADKPIHAYVVRKTPPEPGSMWIVFGDAKRSFLVGAGGVTELTGVRENDLLTGRLALELRPSPDMGSPGE